MTPSAHSRRMAAAPWFAWILPALLLVPSLVLAQSGPPRRWQPLSEAVGGPALAGARDLMLDASRARLLVYTQEAIWAFDLASRAWSPLEPALHPPLEGVPFFIRERVLLDPSADRLLLVHGGEDLGAQILDGATWALDLESPKTWVKLASSGPRNLAPVVIDLANGRLVSFSGKYDGMFDEDTWHSSLASAGWATVLTTPPTPFPRQDHEACFDATRARMWMWGGDGVSLMEDPPGLIWAYNYSFRGLWTGVSVTGPAEAPREGLLTHDPVRDRLLHVGPAGELWALAIAAGGTSGAWTKTTPAAWTPSAAPSAQVYDPAGDRLISLVAGRLWALPLGKPGTGLILPSDPGDFVVRARPAAVEVELTLESAADVAIEIFDVRGRRVAAREAGRLEAGTERLHVPLDGERPSGVYFVRARIGATSAHQRVVLLR